MMEICETRRWQKGSAYPPYVTEHHYCAHLVGLDDLLELLEGLDSGNLVAEHSQL